MPQKCVISGCQSIQRKNCGISFFRFPLNDTVLLEKWTVAIHETSNSITARSIICERHFKKEFLSGKERKRLKINAVPTEFLTLEIDPLQELNDLINSYEQVKTGCKESMSTYNIIDANSNICDMDAHVAPIYSKEGIHANKYLQSPTNEANPESQIKNLKAENEHLTTLIQSLKDNQTNQLQNQADMFQHLLQKQKDVMKKKLTSAQNKIKLLNRQKQRLNVKIIKLLKDAKNKKKLRKGSYNILNEFQTTFKHILQNEKSNKYKTSNGRRYNEEVKKFAMTLYYYSPKAYYFCRKHFTLPHPSSLRAWTSTVNAEPGFHTEILQILKNNIPKEDADCSLIFDGMSIRQQLLWDESQKKFVRYCDYGHDISMERNDIEAKEALVFLLVSLKGIWKWPIGYFLKCQMNSCVLAELIRVALTLTSQANVKVRSITCDGESTNCGALRQLGCNIFVDTCDDIINYFEHPTDKYKVRVILDACHMIKLARNALADYKEFKSNDGCIKWQYFVNLHNMQNKLTFKFKNKLSSQCINYWQNKMKVKYAAHTLSASVANAIDFLKTENIPEFKDSEATVKFIRVIDRLFDFMNSRNPFGKGFKKPIMRTDLEYLHSMIKQHTEYLFSLKTKDGNCLLKSSRKTFLYGLAITAKSILEIARDIFNENNTYKYLLTYKFSQDHLEILFGKIRSRNGFNNNPNVLQFKYAMRNILLHNNIKCSDNSNCLDIDDDATGSILPFRWKKKRQDSFFNDTEYDDCDNCDNCDTEVPINIPENFKNLQNNIIYYIGGYIIKKLKNIKCYNCAINLIAVPEYHNYAHSGEFSKFLTFSNNGGLIKSSASVFRIIKTTEHFIQIYTTGLTNLHINNLNIKILNKVKSTLALDATVFPNLTCDDTDLLEVPHKLLLITLIASRYINIRLHSFAKFYMQEIVKPIKKRHRLTKSILFSSE